MCALKRVHLHVNAKTIDYSKTEIQPGDDVGRAFSFETTEYILDQLPCWLTYTNDRTHKVIDDNLHLSAMYSGMIKGTGPRYCPSIEDKFVRFNDKPRHQLFLEPEGRNTNEVYVQGLSTSLPEHVQRQMLETIPGLEKADMMRAGYAIEYDAIVPTQLWPTLETKMIKIYTQLDKSMVLQVMKKRLDKVLWQVSMLQVKCLVPERKS